MTTSGLDEGFRFKDPATRRNLVFAVVPMTRLAVISHQRKPSEPHVGRVVDSIEPLGESLELREGRAAKLVEAHRLVRTITEHLKERGTWHEFATAQIISYANPLKRARKQHTFDDPFTKLIAKLTDLEANPGKLARGSA